MKIEDIQIPGKLNRKEAELRISFLEHVGVIPGGEKLKACIQCGTCTGSCPVSYAMDISPREVIALFRAGDIETILKSKTIWTCASCYACQTRCPELIKITDIIYALKRTAMDKKIYSKRFPVQSLAGAFVKNLNKFGRVNEPRLLARFLLKTGFLKAFSFIPLGYQMAKKGRVGFQASRIKDLAGLKKIIDAAQKLDMPIEIAVKSYQEDAVGYKAIA